MAVVPRTPAAMSVMLPPIERNAIKDGAFDSASLWEGIR